MLSSESFLPQPPPAQPTKYDTLTALEYSTLRIPYENLNRKFRQSQKHLERATLRVKEAVNATVPLLSGDAPVPIEQVEAPLRVVMDRLAGAEKAVDDALEEEIRVVELMQERIKHLCENEAQRAVGGEEGALALRSRIARMSCEQLLRWGMITVARELVDKFQLRGLVDLEVYENCEKVVEALRAHDTIPVLCWCHEHRSKLRRLESKLELTVRLQEAIECIRNDRRMDALAMMKKHLGGTSGSEAQWPADVEKVMARILCGSVMAAPDFEELLSEVRWDNLIALFREEFYRVYQLPEQSSFSAALQTGIAVFKTPACTSGGNKNCPACDPITFTLAQGLPYAHASNSRLICSQTGEPLNEDNVPYLLPSGVVIGEHALCILQEGDGQVRCPRTNQMVDLSDVVRIFIL